MYPGKFLKFLFRFFLHAHAFFALILFYSKDTLFCLVHFFLCLSFFVRWELLMKFFFII